MSEIATIHPLAAPITATVSVPGSKSYANRALIIAALNKNDVVLRNIPHSDDVAAMVDCLTKLGLVIDSENDSVSVRNSIFDLAPTEVTLNANQSATTLRFLTALCCLIPGAQTLTGHETLLTRPVEPLIQSLQTLGADIERTESGEIVVRSGAFTSDNTTLDASISSQFLTALLLVAPIHGMTIECDGSVASESYLSVTSDCMEVFGAQIEKDLNTFNIQKQSYEGSEYIIEPDVSSASYFWALAALTGSRMTVADTSRETRQGDISILGILKSMGARIDETNEGIQVTGGDLHSITVDMANCPDQIQTIAVVSTFADGVSKISGVHTLSHKETDRLTAIMKELEKMGITTETDGDSLTIHGGKPRAAQIDTYHDHRMAMSFALAGTVIDGIKINNPEVVSKTFPEFWDTLKEIGVLVS